MHKLTCGLEVVLVVVVVVVVVVLVPVDRALRTSQSMAWARSAAPDSPKNGASLVLLLPGIGHLATTTMVPFAVMTVVSGLVAVGRSCCVMVSERFLSNPQSASSSLAGRFPIHATLFLARARRYTRESGFQVNKWVEQKDQHRLLWPSGVVSHLVKIISSITRKGHMSRNHPIIC